MSSDEAYDSHCELCSEGYYSEVRGGCCEKCGASVCEGCLQNVLELVGCGLDEEFVCPACFEATPDEEKKCNEKGCYCDNVSKDAKKRRSDSYRLCFGKWQGHFLCDLIIREFGYVNWLAGNAGTSGKAFAFVQNNFPGAIEAACKAIEETASNGGTSSDEE